MQPSPPLQNPSQDPHAAMRLVKFMLGHLFYGSVGAVLFGGLMLYFNVSGIWTLLSQSQDGFIFGFLLFFGLIITFGAISMGWGVMTLGGFSDNDRYRDERRDLDDD